MEQFLKIVSGMANSVEPDQTAPSGAVWSGSALFAYAISSDTFVYEISEHLTYIHRLSYLDLYWLRIHADYTQTPFAWCKLYKMRKY